MSVRDEDVEVRRFHRIDYYAPSGTADVPSWAERLIVEQVERSPQSWTPRLIWEDLREAGRDGITEEWVAAVMTR